jgi:nitroimidazol reductase NimA-like FMN-containing flavoprotein (pyridoxamine 5'-phosphate oxidase superfamily)
MATPVTKIDKRFSDPAAEATSWDETRAVIEAAELFWITTVRADGRPHVTPLVAVWVDDALYFCTGPEEQKALNLAANPHVILTTGANGWQGGLDVVVEGDAVAVTDDDLLKRLAQAWTAKWDGRWQYQVGNGQFEHMGGFPVPVFGVRPRKVLAFGKGEVFRHTRHTF